VNENFEIEKAKHEIAEAERDKVRRNVEELQTSKERCFSVATQCCGRLRNMFANIGAFSNDENFIRGDVEGAICRRFDPGGSLDRRVKLSLRAPAQMGWRETGHKGAKLRLVLYCAKGGMRLQ
jgi:hypothetical protein